MRARGFTRATRLGGCEDSTDSSSWFLPPTFIHDMNSRAALLAGTSLFAPSSLGAPSGARACAPSLQIISGPIAGPVVSNGGAISVTSSGKISGDPDGIDAVNIRG